MRKNEKSNLWVVYRMTIHGKPSQLNAVCEQCDWDAMELAQPGHHTLVHAGITNEGEAERLARIGLIERGVRKPSKKRELQPPDLVPQPQSGEDVENEEAW